MSHPTPDKSALRKHFLSLRPGVDPRLNASVAKNLATCLSDIPAGQKHIISGYVAMRGEADISAVLQALAESKVMTCLPVADGKNAPLIFRLWKPGDPLEAGEHGTKVPPAAAETVIPQLMLVPLVAFDAEGRRLGYGGGYYDRTIRFLRQENKNLLAIGVAYAIQQADALPHEAHDELLDAVVTEKGTVHFR